MYQNQKKPVLPQSSQDYDKDRSMWTLSYRLKGVAVGIVAVFLFCYFQVGYYPTKYIIAGGILGYFLGWLLGSFFYTKK